MLETSFFSQTQEFQKLVEKCGTIPLLAGISNESSLRKKERQPIDDSVIERTELNGERLCHAPRPRFPRG
jgi:hypothetical protein